MNAHLNPRLDYNGLFEPVAVAPVNLGFLIRWALL